MTVIRKANLINYLHGEFYTLQLAGANKAVNDLLFMYREYMFERKDIIVRYCGKLCVRTHPARNIPNPMTGRITITEPSVTIKLGIPSRPRGCGIATGAQVARMVQLGNKDYIAKALINFVHKLIDECREGNHTLELKGFGKFSRRILPDGRKCMNPQTHKPMVGKSKNMVRFTIDPTLKELLNS